MQPNDQASSLQLEISNRQILKIALPISMALLVPQINFITNNIFLGHLGERELAVAGLTGVYYLIFAAIGFGLNNGLQALIARRAGENRPDEIGRLFSQGLRIALFISGLGILLTYTIAPYILSLSIQSPEVLTQAIKFLQIRIWGLPFLYMYQMRNALLVGTNQSKLLIAGTLAETIANVFLDYGFIYGKFSLPQLGFNGAAYASVIAEAAGMMVVYFVIRWKGISARFSISPNRYNKKLTGLILQQSTPLMFQYGISIISWVFFYILIEHHGERDLAISNTMRNIFGFFGVFTWAFAATSNTMVSNIIGQGKSDLVLLLIRKIVRISLGIAVSIALIINLVPEIFLAIYGQGGQFIQDAIPVVRIVSFALILMSFSTVWLNAILGTGNSKVNLLIETIAVAAYTIYAYLVLEIFRFPIAIGWMAEWLYWTILFLLSYGYMLTGRWRNKHI